MFVIFKVQSNALESEDVAQWYYTCPWVFDHQQTCPCARMCTHTNTHHTTMRAREMA